MIIGIDPGTAYVKVVNRNGAFIFNSAIGEWHERRLKNVFGDDDMEWKYNGRLGFAGTIAQFESDYGGSLKGETKANEDAKLRVLLAIHRHSNDVDNAIVVGQPISKHNDEEKKAIKKMLLGKHELTVNGICKKINITRVEVAAECASTGVLEAPTGYYHTADLGGGTFNWATCFNDGKRILFIDRASDTEGFGMGTGKDQDVEPDIAEMTRALITKTANRWGKHNPVRVIGGVADKVAEALQGSYTNVTPYHPLVNGKRVSPTFANAVAFYTFAKEVYGE
ncbi:hypothetical protein BBD42_30970 [Paenibacillus sp. BIHB 4019]|uniref:Actin-like protein N-terminal domain-containing protein n=1 Tax=Paenibacillus sp. BIHB 4019 TaxID=1870819 RepID=A0A1B2DRU9_9BACL|nr:ParM/StbA family protein [Paenibacillus sp. BIHB 4019]ANY70427.1 hypothetical protein BBD42_30970 [Paenibacillus sp. BIHB 4019]